MSAVHPDLHPHPGPNAAPYNERSILTMIAAVQFINILDFMMVMPMGPDFAEALSIPTSKLGLIGASYTGAAAVSGIIASLFLDQFDRRKALIVTLLGLTIGTALGGFAQGLNSLVMARILAGIFGGPAAALGLSIVFDVIPPARRGYALGIVMGAYSIASVVGVPIGLELARQGGWRMPFFLVAGGGLIMAALIPRMIPPMNRHLKAKAARAGSFSRAIAQSGARAVSEVAQLAARPEVTMGLLVVLISNSGSFLLIPNFSAFLQFNRGFPREKLGLLYLTGGAISFFAMRYAGRVIDRRGSLHVVNITTGVLIATILVEFESERALIPAVVFFASFMVFHSVRTVAVNTQLSKLPAPHERARYQSIQTCVVHMGCAIGAYASTIVLHADASGRLQGIGTLAWITTVAMLLVPLTLRHARATIAR